MSFFACAVLVQAGSATLAGRRTAAVFGSLVADARVLAAAAANHHHVRSIDARFFFDDAALDILRRIRASVPLDKVGVLNRHGIFPRIDGQHAPAFARVLSGHYFYLIAFSNQYLKPLLF